MRVILQLGMALILAMNLSACGTKGKLKTPTQVEQLEQKKAHKAKEAEEKKKADDNAAAAEKEPVPAKENEQLPAEEK
jgi:predicted small lipoprotein YifL